MENVFAMIEIVRNANHPCMEHAHNAIQVLLYPQIILVDVIFLIAYYAMIIFVMFVKKDIHYLNLVHLVCLIIQ